MTIDEAIKILTFLRPCVAFMGAQDGEDALDLAIEALKRVKAYKEAHIGLHYEPMPGETEE